MNKIWKIVILCGVVVAIAGGAGVYFFAPNGTEKEIEQTPKNLNDLARDARIKNEVNPLRAALEIYFVQNAQIGYPTSLSDLGPDNPWPNVAEPERFSYQQTNNGQGYTLEASLHSGETVRYEESMEQSSESPETF